MSQDTKKQPDANLVPRPPIVVVMGHIDHGKTTLLDYIRNAKVAAKESGGITQHIGAYQAELQTKDHQLRTITFLDTPGHEAFAKMRSRGAKVADVAVLVVAADDGVKPQTKEALEAVREAKIPYAVAINKIDKPGADAEKTVRDLAEVNVFLEGKGGDVPWAAISAKEGTGVDQLLEIILLLADMEELKADPQKPAEGVVVESRLDSKRGIAATLLVLDGSFSKGEIILANSSLAKARIMENFKGDNIEKAGPAAPVMVIGFDSLPAVGSAFKAYASQKDALEAQNIAGQKAKSAGKTAVGVEETGEKIITFGVVVKADTLGSAEAVEHEILKIAGEKIKFRFLRMLAGDLTEDDVNLAASAERPLAIVFRSAVKSGAKESAEKLGVTVARFEIIYEIVDFLKERVKSVLPSEEETDILGKAKVLKIFSQKGKKQIVGGRAEEGVLKKGAKINIMRRENKIGEGKISNLQQNKLDTDKVEAFAEFGAMIESSLALAQGDLLEAVKNR